MFINPILSRQFNHWVGRSATRVRSSQTLHPMGDNKHSRKCILDIKRLETKMAIWIRKVNGAHAQMQGKTQTEQGEANRHETYKGVNKYHNHTRSSSEKWQEWKSQAARKVVPNESRKY